MNNLMEKMCNALKDVKNCATEAICSFAQSLEDFNEIYEIRERIVAICGKDVAICFHEDALRIANARKEKAIDVYKKLSDECIEMCIEGKPKDEIIWYFTKLER